MLFGMGVNELIKKKEFYESISNLEFIKNEIIYKFIGIKYIKWLVYKTFWKNFNTKLKIKSKPNLNELSLLKREMTYAEISHLVGFLFVLIISLILLIKKEIEFGIILIISNVIFNLYPSLLQQKNKKRIDKLINKKEIKTVANNV